MIENPDRPKDADVVLGGQSPAPVDGVVLGGWAGVQHHLRSRVVEQRIAALIEALNYENARWKLLLQTDPTCLLLTKLEQLALLKKGVASWNKWRARSLYLRYRNIDLSGANFSGADLSKAQFFTANLSQVNFSRANLFRANLYEANLAEADLMGANLTGVDLKVANLSGANLNYANLSQVDLKKANLTGANLMGANLTGANLRYANLNGANLHQALMPDGTIYG